MLLCDRDHFVQVGAERGRARAGGGAGRNCAPEVRVYGLTAPKVPPAGGSELGVQMPGPVGAGSCHATLKPSILRCSMIGAAAAEPASAPRLKSGWILPGPSSPLRRPSAPGTTARSGTGRRGWWPMHLRQRHDALHRVHAVHLHRKVMRDAAKLTLRPPGNPIRMRQLSWRSVPGLAPASTGAVQSVCPKHPRPA